MARDFAKKNKPGSGSKKSAARTNSARKKTSTRPSNTPPGGGSWRWYGAGVLTGIFLSFVVYLGTLPPTGLEGAGNESSAETITQAKQPPKPRFDFYKMLPEQSIEVEVEPAEVARPRDTRPAERYLLQTGSFRQRDDADARRAELLLLGLEPHIEEASGDNGRWYRVYLGPFDSRSKMAKARSLTAAQGIDTLLLKRG
jgi:cell division septation protein DedD